VHAVQPDSDTTDSDQLQHTIFDEKTISLLQEIVLNVSENVPSIHYRDMFVESLIGLFDAAKRFVIQSPNASNAGSGVVLLQKIFDTWTIRKIWNKLGSSWQDHDAHVLATFLKAAASYGLFSWHLMQFLLTIDRATRKARVLANLSFRRSSEGNMDRE